MNFGFSMVFFAVWPGGRRCANCRDTCFFERYCDESIFTWKTCKTTMEKNKKTVQTHGQGLGRGLAGDMGLNFFFFLFFPLFFAVWPKPRENKKTQKKKTKSSDPWARSGLSTHKPKNQKTKKTRNQKTKKPKNQKNQKKQDCTPQGEGVRCRVLGLVFCFFCFFGFLFFWFFGFLFFWFFGFLVCVWIAIADVPSRDFQALSVVALEARSIHYSTAMFAMT